MRQPEVSPDVLKAVTAVRGSARVLREVDPARCALVVIDMQHFFLDRGSPLEVAAAREIVPNINRLAAVMRDTGGTVIWVRMTLDDDALDAWSVFLPVNGVPADRASFCSLEVGKPGHLLWDDLDVSAGDQFVDKNRFSALIQGSSDLQQRLEDRGIDTLFIVGTLTNVCCESTARDAMMLNYKVVMVDDANASVSERAHRASLDNFVTYFGDVWSADQVVEMLRMVP